MILGLTGTFGAGKSSLAEMLKKHGFQQYIMSDILREELKKQGKEETRDNMLTLGNTWREQYGQGVIIDKIVEKAKKHNHTNILIDGLRTVGEVKAIKSHHGKVIGIDASVEIRYQRIKKRGSSKDDITFEKFQEQEKNEHVKDCIAEADYVIFCDGNLDELEQEAKKMMEELQL